MFNKVVNMCVVLFLLLSINCFAESYVCIAEISSGIKFDTTFNKWSQSGFMADEKYIVTKNQEKYMTNNYVVVQPGDTYPSYRCTEDFNEYGWLFCESGLGSFKFSRKALRFLSTYEAGYVDGKDAPGNTPSITVGKCTAF